MITMEKLLEIEQNAMPQAAAAIDKKDVGLIVGWLAEKEGEIGNKALLLLQNRSIDHNDVYPFWHAFEGKLKSDHPDQKNIGIMLIAANTKWDRENRMDETIDAYLLCLNDKNPVVVRQCIQSLGQVLPYKKHLYLYIADRLISINITDIEATARKAVLIDILEVLLVIRKGWYPDEVEQFISMALAGDLLDPNDKKQIKSMMRQ